MFGLRDVELFKASFDGAVLSNRMNVMQPHTFVVELLAK